MDSGPAVCVLPSKGAGCGAVGNESGLRWCGLCILRKVVRI